MHKRLPTINLIQHSLVKEKKFLKQANHLQQARNSPLLNHQSTTSCEVAFVVSILLVMLQNREKIRRLALVEEILEKNPICQRTQRVKILISTNFCWKMIKDPFRQILRGQKSLNLYKFLLSIKSSNKMLILMNKW